VGDYVQWTSDGPASKPRQAGVNVYPGTFVSAKDCPYAGTKKANGVVVNGEPKKQEPEIMPPVPEVEPEQNVPEIPPNKDPPEKKSPIEAER